VEGQCLALWRQIQPVLLLVVSGRDPVLPDMGRYDLAGAHAHAIEQTVMSYKHGSNRKRRSHPFLPPVDEPPLQALENDVSFGEITEEIRAKRIAAGLNPDTGEA
jgi:hypothetical protein